jgi:hypothetical protein
LERSHFSDSEWRSSSLPNNNHQPQCFRCLRNYDEDKKTANRNYSSIAKYTDYDLMHPFAEGQFRFAAKGVYTDGLRQGESCVCKWFKGKSALNEEFYNLDILAMRKALEIVDWFNNAKVIAQTVKVNIPEVWEFGKGSPWEGIKALQEPYIANFRKFNSNTGWYSNTRSLWDEVMAALSHFSYYQSDGNYVLCDLQVRVQGFGLVWSGLVWVRHIKRNGSFVCSLVRWIHFFSRAFIIPMFSHTSMMLLRLKLKRVVCMIIVSC